MKLESSGFPATWYLSTKLPAIILSQKSISLRYLMKMMYKGVKKCEVTNAVMLRTYVVPECICDRSGRWNTSDLCVTP